MKDEPMESKTPMKKYWAGQSAPAHADAWFEFYKAVVSKGTLDKKTKELVAVACSALMRCKHCVRAHIKDAKRAGASKNEIAEAITMASMIASGSQIFWNDEYEDLLGKNACGG